MTTKYYLKPKLEETDTDYFIRVFKETPTNINELINDYIGERYCNECKMIPKEEWLISDEDFKYCKENNKNMRNFEQCPNCNEVCQREQCKKIIDVYEIKEITCICDRDDDDMGRLIFLCDECCDDDDEIVCCDFCNNLYCQQCIDITRTAEGNRICEDCLDEGKVLHCIDCGWTKKKCVNVMGDFVCEDCVNWIAPNP